MTIISLGHSIIPPPGGIDFTDANEIAKYAHLLQVKDFVMPFFAHAFGTLVGAFIAAKISKDHKLLASILISLFFLSGGIYMFTIVPTPTWIMIVEILIAYIPMGLIGYKLGK